MALDTEAVAAREVRARICPCGSAESSTTTSGVVSSLQRSRCEPTQFEAQTAQQRTSGACGGLARCHTARAPAAAAAAAAKHRTRTRGTMRALLPASLLLVLLAVALHTRQPALLQRADALKLPSFLASWIPQAPQQQQQQQQQAPQLQSQNSALPAGTLREVADSLTASGSADQSQANLIAFSGAPAPAGDQRLRAASPTATPAKRPFGSLGAKHANHHHLFSALPKSLFGRILGGASQPQQQQQQLNQQLYSGHQGAILSPMTRQQQQQLMMAMVANSNKFQLANGNAAGQAALLWPQHQQLMAPPGGNFSRQPFMSGQQQQQTQQQQSLFALAHPLRQQHEHAITAFRPAMPPHQQQQQQQQVGEGPPKKHALGYGEADDDFEIVNAQQVPELAAQQRPQVPQVPQVPQQPQQQRPPVSPTRHPSEEYREMPAIVIADPDEDLSSFAAPAGASTAAAANRTLTNATNATSEQADSSDPVKLSMALASSSNATIVEASNSGNNQTTTHADVAPLPQVETGNSTSEARHPPVVDDHQVAAAAVAMDPQHQLLNSTQAQADTPEGNRQESVASAVIVASNEALPQQHVQQQQQHSQLNQESQAEQEALESFVLGPYKGLTLGDDGELASSSAAAAQLAQMESSAASFIDHQAPLHNAAAAAQFAQQFPSPQANYAHMHQQQQQQPMRQQHATFGGGQNLLGSASNLLQQARQLIQLPFAHLPHNTHFHQQQQAPQRRPLMRPQQTQQQHQQHWPAMFGAPHQPHQQQHQQQPMSFYSPLPQQHQQQQHQQVAQSMRRPQVHFNGPQQQQQQQQTGSGSRMPAYFFEGQNFAPQQWHPQARPTVSPGHFQPQQPQTAAFNLLLDHGNGQMHPSSAYFVDSSHSQQPAQLPALAPPPPPHAPHEFRQPTVVESTSGPLQQLDSNQTFVRPHPNNQQQTMAQNKHKSGLYQIEPPKLSGDKFAQQQQQQQQQVASSDDEATAQQQQQKIDVQENASDEELGGDGSAADEDDEPQQQQQQEAQSLESQQQQHTQQMIAVAEPTVDQQSQSNSNSSFAAAAAANQILQVGASFGVAPPAAGFNSTQTTTLSAPENQTVQHERRGQVFNEPIRPLAHQQQVALAAPADHDTTTAYEFRPQHQQQQQSNYLDTQVYTLPYTMSVQNQVASFVPQQQLQRRPVAFPARSFAGLQRLPQMVVQPHWQQQQLQQQTPVTFIRTGAEWERQPKLPAPAGPPSWANGGAQAPGQLFHHYQPLVDQNTVTAGQAYVPVQATTQQQQQQQQQFVFAVQHQPGGDGGASDQASQLAAQVPIFTSRQPQQPQVVESAPSQSEQPQQQQQQQQSDVSVEPVTTSHAHQLASSSTTPSSRIDDDAPAPAADFSPQVRRQQLQQANRLGSDERQDRKSAQAKPGEEPQQEQQQQQQAASPVMKQVAARSPSSFCAGRASGLYADVEQRCKAYYQCAPTGHQMFQCNNQTQFNQKTQNCDWWYNVDCGGRLGSPEDFEQALGSSPRSQLADMDSQLALGVSPASVSGATPLSPEQQQQQQQQQPQQSTSPGDLRSFVEPPANSATTPLVDMTTPLAGPATTAQVPSATTAPAEQQQQQQTTTIAASEERALFAERGSSTPQSATGGEQRQSADETSAEQQQTAAAAATSSSSSSSGENQLIEVVASGGDSPAQPRVGASEETAAASTPASVAVQQPTTTTQATLTTTATTTGGQQQQEAEAQNEVTTQREQQQQQISTAVSSGTAPTPVSGKSSARRLIQSEFGGSAKTARASVRKLRHHNQAQTQQQQQLVSVGDLLAVDALTRAPLDEVSQLHAQGEHHSVRLGAGGATGAPTESGQQQQQNQLIYSTSANQGSVSYDPQAGVREQQTVDLLGQFAPPARMGLAASEQQQQQQKSEIGGGGESSRTSTTLERRFGARLTPRRT